MAVDKVQGQEVRPLDFYYPQMDFPAISKPAPAGISAFPTTIESYQPAKEETSATSGVIDWFLSFFWTATEEAPVVAPEALSPLPSRPALAAPAPEARHQVEEFIQASREVNRTQRKALEEIKDLTEVEQFKRLIAIFKEVASLNETLMKHTIEDYKEDQKTIQALSIQLREGSRELERIQSKETIAKTAQTAAAIFSIGALAFIAAGATFAAMTGFVPAALPAMAQAMSATGFTALEAALTGAQGAAQLFKTHLEGQRAENEGGALRRRDKIGNIDIEFKDKLDALNRFMEQINTIFSELREIGNKRRETTRWMIGG